MNVGLGDGVHAVLLAGDIPGKGYDETAMQDQAPLGPEADLAVPAEDGGVDLYVTTQWLHADREQIAQCLRLPEEKVWLHLAGVGGAFGSREDIHMQIHGSLLALRTGRAVKMSFGREKSFHAHVHRHPSRIWMRHGVTRDGRPTARPSRPTSLPGCADRWRARGRRWRCRASGRYRTTTTWCPGSRG